LPKKQPLLTVLNILSAVLVTGALALILFVPTVNVIFIIVLMALPSRQEENEHGPPPFGPIKAE